MHIYGSKPITTKYLIKIKWYNSDKRSIFAFILQYFAFLIGSLNSKREKWWNRLIEKEKFFVHFNVNAWKFILFWMIFSNFPINSKVMGILLTVWRNVKIAMYADVVQYNESANSWTVFALNNRNITDDTLYNAIGNKIIKVFELIGKFAWFCDVGDGETPNVL